MPRGRDRLDLATDYLKREIASQNVIVETEKAKLEKLQVQLRNLEDAKKIAARIMRDEERVAPHATGAGPTADSVGIPIPATPYPYHQSRLKPAQRIVAARLIGEIQKNGGLLIRYKDAKDHIARIIGKPIGDKKIGFTVWTILNSGLFKRIGRGQYELIESEVSKLDEYRDELGLQQTLSVI